MVFQTINNKLLELGPSLGFLFKKTCSYNKHISHRNDTVEYP